MSLPSGTRLGPYEIVQPIGSGGMGDVYRARDTRLDRDVAVKVLPERFARDAEARMRFEREAKAVAALTHPNILAIHDYGSDGGAAYSVTELLEGETLRRRIIEGPIPWRKAVGDRRGDRGRTRRRAREGHHPPRPQAGEHLPHRRTGA